MSGKDMIRIEELDVGYLVTHSDGRGNVARYACMTPTEVEELVNEILTGGPKQC